MSQRTGLRRLTAMKPSKPLQRTTPLKKGAELGRNSSAGKAPQMRPETVARRRPRDTGPDAATRKLVLERDGYRCVCCGRSIIGQRYSLQHRQRRSQGGDNSPANILTVLGDGTQGCHARIDSRIDPHDEAKGYTVRSWDDPALVPVMLFSAHGSGVMAWATADGRWVTEPPGAS